MSRALDGYTQIQDPGIAGVSPLNGLTSGYSNRAIQNPAGETVLVNPQPGEVGTLGLGTLRGPGSIRLDFNMIKRFMIDEKRNFEFRVDVINALNVPISGIRARASTAITTSDALQPPLALEASCSIRG